MPRHKTKGRRKSKSHGLSEASKMKLYVIGEEAQEETLDSLLADFDIQTETFIRQARRTYISTAKKVLQILPPKSAFPKEILKMPANEFRLRGGSLAAVMESLKAEKQGVVVTGFLELNKEKRQDTRGGAVDMGKENNPIDSQAYVTPAMSTRSRALTGLAAGQTTGKRMPKPLERVTMTTCSTSTGSPLDERTFLQLQLDQAMEDMKATIMETSNSFPQKWRSQLMKALKTCKTQVYAQEQELLTPALQR